MNKKEIKFYIAILIIVIAYWIISFYLTLDPFTKRVTTTITLIGAVTFWLQFKRSERLNESSYIMNLNNQFITNKDMSLVEHELELYYNQYEALGPNGIMERKHFHFLELPEEANNNDEGGTHE